MAAPTFSGASRFNESFHSPCTRGPSPNSTSNDTLLLPEMEPILPDLCMEQLWTEPTGPSTRSPKASKVFLTSDFCKNNFLCFLVDTQLRCVKFIQSNVESRLICTSVTNIPASDAAPLQSINAMLVLEAGGSLVLYTGTTRVSKVFVAGLLSPSFVRSGHAHQPDTPLASASTPTAHANRLPRLDQAAMPSPLSELRGSKHHLQTSWLEDYSFPQSPDVQALRDPVSNRITLELSNGTMFRVSIPEICTSTLVKKCLQAIRFILPKNAAMKVLVKWYNTYNAPGGPSSHTEWNQFVTCFLSLLGYNTERLAWIRNLCFEVPLSPVIAAKKARPSDGGSDEDWEYLLASQDLQLEQYIDLYWRDYPEFISKFNDSCPIDQALIGQMVRPSYLKAEPPSVLGWFSSCLWGEEVQPFPFLPGICERTRLLILSYALYIVGDVEATSSNQSKYLTKLTDRRGPDVVDLPGGSSLAEKLILWLSSSGFTLKDLESVPFGVALPIREAIYRCREQPYSDWSEEVCLLIGRQDLTKQAHKMSLANSKTSVGSGVSLEPSSSSSSTEPDEEEDGMSDISGESSRPVRVRVQQLPEVSDHDFIEEKENKLLQLCQRTMSLPVGRGLFSLFSYQPVPTQPLPVPKLNLTGRAPPRSTMVDLSSGNIDVPANMTSWSSFHNGVAAGLKIAPASQVDSAWIAYNKPKSPELANEYAGFLMALGLNGHLTKLATLNIHDYLTKGHEMTSIGLLLGVSSAKLGTMDMSITRLLSIHIPALLPPTSTELDVPHNVQVAAVLGIGRPPGPEMEYCTDRESYSLAAGLALGMVCLGLYQYMVGGHRRPQPGCSRDRHKSPSYQIKEGDSINVDVTCPGATLALAMIYLKTNNRSIADWLKAPDTILSPAHDYIVAGACLAVGFRFAGSSNSEAFECLYSFCRSFMKTLTSSTAAVTGHYNLQTCLSMVLLALSMVMCGSGDLRVLQVCRFLHKRTGGEMNYGFHMAHHMALGILFLGRGRLSLNTSNSAIAALLCALYPHYPAHSTDNRYHLQALRHLVVLAAQPRLLVPVDVDTLKPCYALLDLTYKESQWYKETTVEIMAPTLLPELHLLKQVKVKGPRYWELSIVLSKDTQHLRSILSRDGVLYVKLRAGRLPYKEDPQGWKSLLASKVNQHSSKLQAFKPEDISTFTSDAALVSFSELFCKDSTGNKQVRLVLELVERRALQGVPGPYSILLSSHFLSVIHSMADITMETWHNDNSCMLGSYLRTGVSANQNSMLACFLVYSALPSMPQASAEERARVGNMLMSFAPLGLPFRELLRLAPVLLAPPPGSVSQPVSVS
ncbi:hypothetical protein NHX12_022057 [Muraenolepis orangiensis]|uniref:Anaphase-promoting complex subunit 1 n=1 Tax=Muraenolepis orangiensis TaxID=630683 RepID=A0A9Q0EQV9_9TELE|nr:hypothetical protein NHX12_022057 [Muraenolepis orangiensis]